MADLLRDDGTCLSTLSDSVLDALSCPTMSTLSSTMVNAAQSLDEEISSLTDSSIKLRKALLELQRNVAIVDSYTLSRLELKWKAVRGEYDGLLHALNETAKLCADTIGDYLLLLTEISNPDMFEDARIELRASIEKLKTDNSDKDLSDKFNQFRDSFVQSVNEIDTIIMHKDQEVNSNLDKAKEQVSSAKDEVARLQTQRAEKERQCWEFRNPKHNRAALESAEKSGKELADAKKRMKSAHAAMAQADTDAQVHRKATNWLLIRSSLGNAKVQLGIVASGHLAMDKAHRILTAEVEGHLKAFDEFSLAKTQSNQLALTNYHRKAFDNQPKLVRIQNSLEKFAFEFK